jgi:catechol-2,3-dioxygenase
MLLVSDLERSLAWYRDILGFVVAEELRREEPSWPPSSGRKVRFLPNGIGPDRRPPASHGVRLCCATRRNVNRLAVAIQRAQQDHPGSAGRLRASWVVLDPDGYAISIFWRRIGR